jgi:hypothetical protein
MCELLRGEAPSVNESSHRYDFIKGYLRNHDASLVRLDSGALVIDACRCVSKSLRIVGGGTAVGVSDDHAVATDSTQGSWYSARFPDGICFEIA